MFKNLIPYRIAQGWAADLAAIEEALAKSPFIECGATQQFQSTPVITDGRTTLCANKADAQQVSIHARHH